MNRPRSTAMETRFDNLARVVRAWSDRRPSSSGQVPPWLAKLQAREQAPAGRRRRLLGVTAVAAVAVVALTVLRGFGHSDAVVTFVVSEGAAADSAAPAGSGGTPSIAGQVSSGRLPARMAFSDGSAVVLQPGARGTVIGTTARGARVRLDRGRAHFAVAHRPRTDWAIEAGPFLVIVHGTVFDVSWAADAGALTVDLLVGSVTIDGPASVMKPWGGRTTLKAGQRLVARASTGVGRIGPIDSTSQGEIEGTVPADVDVQKASAAIAPPPALADTRGAQTGDGSSDPVTGRGHGQGQGDDRVRGGRDGEDGPRPRGHVGSAPSRAGAAAALVEASSTWASRVASGSFQGVVADADTIGIERCLSQVSAGSLGALADAARYVRRTDLARRALLAERRRFTGSAGAHDAAFLIGRLADDAAGDAREALVWYDRYLEEGAQGTYAAEALGRKMMALDRLDEQADARSTAQRYLELYPTGPFATRAARFAR